MKDQSISIHEAHKLEETTGKFIIGIKNGVTFPLIQQYVDDIITVSEQQAELIWKKTINLSVEIVDLTASDHNT